MDRRTVFTGALPQDIDILQPQKNAMIGLGALAQAVIGPQAATPAIAIDGLACTATVPSPSLVLNISPGSVYAQGVVDQSAFGSLPADLTDNTILQGISLSTIPLTFVPPSTAGFATNYLIQVGLSVQDTTPVVLPYYNAANPTVPWLGPNNSGVAQNTVRACVAVITAKPGVAASAGTQVTPAADPGYYGLYSVTVAQGATSLTSSNFSPIANAPFIPTTLMALPNNIQSNKWTFAADTGTANALVVTLNPAPLAIVQGMEIVVYKGASANTTAASINVNGAGAVSIHNTSGAALTGGEMPGHSMLTFVFDGTYWQLETAITQNFGGPLFDGDATGTNTYTVSNLTPTAASLTNRMLIKISFANANTSSCTLNIGFGANPIVFSNGVALSGGEITGDHLLSYHLSSASWELLTPTIPQVAVPASIVHYGTDTSVVANSIIATVTPSVSAYSIGHFYGLTNVANTNTAGVTANFNGIGTRVVCRADGSACLPGDIQSGSSLLLFDNGTQLEIVNKNSPKGALPTLQVFPTNGTYTPSSSDVRWGLMFATGGGGGGGGNARGGGGSGATAIDLIPINISTSLAIVIGAGGTAGTTTGGAGGTTTVGGVLSAGGGGGGWFDSNSMGGLGGVATVGALQLTGNPGLWTLSVPSGGGLGGGSFWGGGGLGSRGSAHNGLAGVMGGGGGGSSYAGGIGGAGGNGLVVILEF